jgi:hypothetical protein
MTMQCPQLDYSRLQAPPENRTALIEPPAECAGELLAENLCLRNRLDYDLQGRSLAEVSRQARAELLDAARRWTAAYRDVTPAPPDPHGLVFLAGHQPQMFHPGVWFKNFMLGDLARRHGATAINLIVDADAVSDTSLRVPGGSAAEPNAASIPFDRPDPRIPYEERKIEDREVFASFGHRAIEQIRSLVPNPLLAEYWPLVQARAQHSDNLGTCLVQARHQLEASWGLETLEVPQSWVCAGEAFQWFTAHLLAQLPRFREAYNASLGEYRRLHHVRSSSHPAPDLAEDAPWLGAPFWIWTAEDPRRRRLYAKIEACQSPGEILLSDRQSWEARLPLGAEGNAGNAVGVLLELQRRGVRIRPRALVTTLWARLALGDLFIHGIGGAKYDQVTNRLIERFFGLAVPRFLVASATLHLPIDRDRTTADDLRAIQHDLRGMTYHPERYLSVPYSDEERGPTGTADLIAEKQRWIATPQTVENARSRCRAIRRVNAALQPWLIDRRRQLVERLGETSQRFLADSVLTSREYGFCLHPESTLREFLSGATSQNRLKMV